MKLEGHIHCEGPDCDLHAHVGADTMEAERLPIGFVKLIWYGGNGKDGVHGFCGPECAMKWCAQIPPPEEFEGPPPGFFGESDGAGS